MDALISVVIGGAFTVLGVIIGWGLNDERSSPFKTAPLLQT